MPQELTPAERRSEIVAILARGFLRLICAATAPSEKSAVNREEDLEAVSDKSLYASANRSIE